MPFLVSAAGATKSPAHKCLALALEHLGVPVAVGLEERLGFIAQHRRREVIVIGLVQTLSGPNRTNDVRKKAQPRAAPHPDKGPQFLVEAVVAVGVAVLREKDVWGGVRTG